MRLFRGPQGELVKATEVIALRRAIDVIMTPDFYSIELFLTGGQKIVFLYEEQTERDIEYEEFVKKLPIT